MTKFYAVRILARQNSCFFRKRVFFDLRWADLRRYNLAAAEMGTPTFVILLVCFASIALADDFKTNDGKEYKNATVTRVEADGIIVRTKGGISKLYFTELPKDVKERFHYNPAQATAAPREREQIALRAEQDAIRRQTDQRIRQLHTPVAAPDFSPLFLLVVVIATLVVATSIIVTAVRAKQRRELRERLFIQARDFTAAIQKNQSLPPVPTDIILKPGESAFYSTPSALYETRAVRTYQAAHSGVRVAKGVYIGGTSGRSISTQQWAALDTGRLTITNQRLVFVGGKEDRTIPLKKIVSVNSSLTEILVSVEGRQKTIALAVPNPLIAKFIIGLCSQVADPSNLSGDKLTVTFKE